jgi:uncharacterized membrane protein
MFNLIFSKRWYFLRTEADRLLVPSMIFSVLLVVASLGPSGYPGSLFLVWNLFLAYIPYAISNSVAYRPQWVENGWKFMLLFVAWLFFIPNSFYLITDLFHLGQVKSIPGWYHLVMLISFAWNGLLLGVVSVWQMERLLQIKWGNYNHWFFIYPIMWLNALGIYIGRYLRFNSWDVITDPFDLLSDIVKMLIHPIQYKYAWGMVLSYSVFMTLVYMVLKRIGKIIG